MIINHPNPIFLNSYYNDKVIKINLFLSLFVNVGLWLLVIWQTKNLGELISLHYNIYFGIDLLGFWYQIYLLPGLGLLFFLINFVLAGLFYSKEKIISYFLIGGSTFSQIIFFLATIFIILINLS